MAERDRQKAKTRAWTGDVWKIVPLLKEHRPDLKFQLFDVAPTGLVVVSNLDPENRALSDNYDAIIKTYDNISDVEEIAGRFDIASTTRSPWATRVKKRAAAKHCFAIQLPVPRPRVRQNWGDYHFGVGLAEALQRKGHAARVQTRKHWAIEQESDEVDIVIRGRAKYRRRFGHLTLYWLISAGLDVPEEELGAVDHVFVAGLPAMKSLANKYGDKKFSLLPQCFDSERMFAPKAQTKRSGIVFVGISRRFGRPMVAHALATNTDIAIWGGGWADSEAAKFLKGTRIANEDLGACYGNAEIILNDHTPAMAANGLTSNRIFDALACATPVISDPVAWMPDDIAKYVSIAGSPEEFSLAMDAIRAETAKKKSARRAFARQMVARHSFDARAEAIISKADELLA